MLESFTAAAQLATTTTAAAAAAAAAATTNCYTTTTTTTTTMLYAYYHDRRHDGGQFCHVPDVLHQDTSNFQYGSFISTARRFKSNALRSSGRGRSQSIRVQGRMVALGSAGT